MSDHILRLYNMELQHSFSRVHNNRLSPLVHYVGKDYMAVEVRDTETSNCYFGNVRFNNTNYNVMDDIFVKVQEIFFKGK